MAFDGLFLNSDRGSGALPSKEGKAFLENKTTENQIYTVPTEGAGEGLRLRLRYADLYSGGKKRTVTDCQGRNVKVNPQGFSVLMIGSDTLEISVIGREETVNGIDTRPIADVKVRFGDKELETTRLTENVVCGNDENLLCIELNGREMAWSLASSRRGHMHKLELPSAVSVQKIGFGLTPGDAVEISELTVKPLTDIEVLYGDKPEWEGYDAEEALLLAQTADQIANPLVGRWKVFDYDFDDAVASLPVDYEFVILPVCEGCYDIVYLSGGRGSAKAGEVKARLKRSGFEGVWDVEWLTADGRLLREGIRLTPDYSAGAADDFINGLSGYSLLKLSFPMQSASFRLRRIAQ